MSFAENLRKLRKDKGLSQEELAQIMDVSRQAVSKWEQGAGFPEVEKLLLLSSRFGVSLDSLMSTEPPQSTDSVKGSTSGQIVITSPNENVVATCVRVSATQEMKGGRNSPRYALFGVAAGGSSFWGESTAFLAWYENSDALAKEISEIQKAIAQGIPTYELRYSVKTERKLLGVRIKKDND